MPLTPCVRYVYHIETEQWRLITLPGPYARCFIQGDTIAIATTTGQMSLSSWSGSTMSLDVESCALLERPAGWAAPFGNALGLLFHPTEFAPVFVVAVYSPSPQPKGTSLHNDMLCG